ncbi:MAG: S4 domain-containing protein, partial [Glaciecola sp.]|nr:S4 domain-containing protein [Glaciecola sp.]
DDMPELTVALSTEGMGIASLLKEANLVASTSEAMRMIKQGAVKIDGEKVDDPKHQLTAAGEAVYQVGKRKFARITLVA